MSKIGKSIGKASLSQELSDDIEVVGPGQILAQGREAMSLTQQNVADRLNFRLSLVKDIENEVFDKSLPSTFNRGYLRNFAKLVNVSESEVINAYEILFLKTNNMVYGYQLAELQFSIKRLAEAQNTIVKTITCKEIENAYVQFAIGKDKSQNVSLKAAAYNLQGLIFFELKDTKRANSAFNEALKIMPEFATATQNLNSILLNIKKEKGKINNVTKNN